MTTTDDRVMVLISVMVGGDEHVIQVGIPPRDFADLKPEALARRYFDTAVELLQMRLSPLYVSAK